MIANIRQVNFHRHCVKLNHLYSNFKTGTGSNYIDNTRKYLSVKELQEICVDKKIKYHNMIKNISFVIINHKKYYLNREVENYVKIYDNRHS